MIVCVWVKKNKTKKEIHGHGMETIIGYFRVHLPDLHQEQ